MYTESHVTVDACVTVRGTCPAEYVMCGELVEFHFGGPRDGFHFAFDATALRTLAKLSGEATARLDEADDVADVLPGSDADQLAMTGGCG